MSAAYDLRYTIDPELHRRAVTHPIVPRNPRAAALRNIAAAVCVPLSIYAFERALFDGTGLLPMAFGFVLGAVLVLAVWWRQHRAMVRLHARYNEEGGEMWLQAGPEGLVTGRPGIESHLAWRFVRAVREIDGAVLIELPAARLIVPAAALDDAARFAADLRGWSEAAA